MFLKALAKELGKVRACPSSIAVAALAPSYEQPKSVLGQLSLCCCYPCPHAIPGCVLLCVRHPSLLSQGGAPSDDVRQRAAAAEQFMASAQLSKAAHWLWGKSPWEKRTRR